MQASQHSSPAGVWHYVSRQAGARTEFPVFDGVDSEPICVLRHESNARRIVETGNKTGHPDLAAMAADEQDQVWDFPSRSANR